MFVAPEPLYWHLFWMFVWLVEGKKIYTHKFSVMAAVDISKVINKCLSFRVYSVRELFSSVTRNLYSKWLTFVSEDDDTKCLKFYFFVDLINKSDIVSHFFFIFISMLNVSNENGVYCDKKNLTWYSFRKVLS